MKQHLSIHISKSIYIYLSACLTFYPFVCLSVCLAVCLCVCQSVYLSVLLSIILPIFLSLFLFLCVCLPVCHSLSVNLTLWLSAYPLTSQYSAPVQQSYLLIDRPAHALSLRKVRLRKKESKGESARERMGE